MVIIPTEKRLDWTQTPVVLITLIVMNIAIYFVYQSNDNTKYEKAFLFYQKSNLISTELPLFEQYLQQQGDLKVLADLKGAEPDDKGSLIHHVILRLDFYYYIDRHYEKYFTLSEYQQWSMQRHQVNQYIMSMSGYALGMVPVSLKPLSFISYQFLHGSLLHLAGNMLFLALCGFAVEAAVGHKLFLGIYLASGIVGAFLHYLFNQNEHLPLVGASGAISGVMAMYVAAFRLKKIEFFYWVFIFVGYFRAPALFILAFFIAQELINYFIDTESSVAFLAHLGGFITGAALIAALLKLKPDIFNKRYIEEEQDIDPIQKKYAKVYELIESFQFSHALRAINELIKEKGLNFDFALLRYNLSKLEKNSLYQKSATDLLQMTNLDIDQIEKLSDIWAQDKALRSMANEKHLLRLGLSFCELKNPHLAEDIFKILYKKDNAPDNLAVLARKLSGSFEDMNDTAKKQHYQEIAHAIFERQR